MNFQTIAQCNLDIAKRVALRQFARIDFVDREARSKINRTCPGYSTSLHWRFFRFILEKYQPKSIAVAGVYHGRDIASLAMLGNRLNVPNLKITGIDLFSDQPLPDWTPEQRAKTWEENGFGPSPTLEQASQNLASLQVDNYCHLVKSDAIEFFNQYTDRFDFIYIDTSHDYYTTRETIRAAKTCINLGGIFAGDDYLDFATWGVKSAVAEEFPNHKTFCSDFIWYTGPT